MSLASDVCRTRRRWLGFASAFATLGAVGAKPRARLPYVDPTPPDRAAS